MSFSQRKELDRKKLFADPFLITVIVGIFLFLIFFILYPLSILLVDSMYVDERFSLSVFFRVLQMHSFRTAITNTLFLGMITGITATLIGFLFAYVDAYVNTGSKDCLTPFRFYPLFRRLLYCRFRQFFYSAEPESLPDTGSI